MRSPVSRREVLTTLGTCAAHLALAASGLSMTARRGWALPSGRVVAREPFGALEQVAEGVWALISNPLGGDRTTLANGGLVAGRSGVLAVEGFNTPAGATWLAEQSRRLTGRWPTHVVVTHYHADHANGLAGYCAEGQPPPACRMTEVTRGLVRTRNTPADQSREAALADAVAVSPDAPSIIDLGGRTARLLPTRGHTASDVLLHVQDADVAFGGDCFWNGMVPNYVDADPPALRAAHEQLAALGARRLVPGHGAVGDTAALARYRDVLDELERAARAAHAAGTDATTAASAYALPPSLGEWVLFNRAFFARAFAAWYRVLG